MRKTTFGIMLKQRDIVLVYYPYTDLTASKKRPALVLSFSGFNNANQDVILCAITSCKRHFNAGIIVNNSDLEDGKLMIESVIKPEKIMLLNKKLIEKRIGRLNKEKSKAVFDDINEKIRLKE